MKSISGSVLLITLAALLLLSGFIYSYSPFIQANLLALGQKNNDEGNDASGGGSDDKGGDGSSDNTAPSFNPSGGSPNGPAQSTEPDDTPIQPSSPTTVTGPGGGNGPGEASIQRGTDVPGGGNPTGQASIQRGTDLGPGGGNATSLGNGTGSPGVYFDLQPPK